MVAHSSTESAYKAVANIVAEVIWIRSLLYELGISLPKPATFWCDNIRAIYLSTNPRFHALTKHIDQTQLPLCLGTSRLGHYQSWFHLHEGLNC